MHAEDVWRRTPCLKYTLALFLLADCQGLSEGNDTCISDCEKAPSGSAFMGQDKAVGTLTRSKTALLSYEANNNIHGNTETIWLYMTKKKSWQSLETQAGLLLFSKFKISLPKILTNNLWKIKLFFFYLSDRFWSKMP